MRLGSIDRALFEAGQSRSRPPPRPPEEPSNRALVPTEPQTAANAGLPLKGPHAVFLAHLIAIASDAPQTRQRRRAAPQDALAAYAAQANLSRPAPACFRVL